MQVFAINREEGKGRRKTRLEGERLQDEKKKKRKYQIKNRKSQILEHAFIFPKLLFKKQKKEII